MAAAKALVEYDRKNKVGLIVCFMFWYSVVSICFVGRVWLFVVCGRRRGAGGALL